MSYNTSTPLCTWVDGSVWVSSPRCGKELLLCQVWLSFLRGICVGARAFPVAVSGLYSVVAVHGLIIAGTSFAAEHGL